MIRPRGASWALLVFGVAAGTATDAPHARPPLLRGGYRVLEADFHVHSFFGDGGLAPWDLVLEARRRGLHAFAITNHNQVFAARLGRWFAGRIGGPIVLVGEEITHPRHHLVAVGITRAVDWRQPAAEAIDAVHRQGGIAIAAHPVETFWPAFDETALRRLDGAEVAHPAGYRPRWLDELRAFLRRAQRMGIRLAPIGSSDYHVLIGGLGICRTYVFAREESEAGVLEAVRAGRTVAYDVGGQVHGDPDLVALMGAAPPTLTDADPARASGAFIAAGLGSVCGWLGLLGLVLFAPAGGLDEPVPRGRPRTSAGPPVPGPSLGRA